MDEVRTKIYALQGIYSSRDISYCQGLTVKRLVYLLADRKEAT
jgi:hypothetical protein